MATPNPELTGRQQCGGKPFKKYNIYAENSVSKNAPLLAVRYSDWLGGLTKTKCFDLSLLLYQIPRRCPFNSYLSLERSGFSDSEFETVSSFVKYGDSASTFHAFNLEIWKMLKQAKIVN